MAGINANHVYLPTPDQSSTTGAVAMAATTATAPTDAKSALGNGWDTSGYVDSNGLSMSINRSMTAIRDWSQSLVRNALTEFTGELSLAFLQMDEFTAKALFGDTNVTKTAATTTAGEKLKISIGNDLPAVKSFCFSMKDGDARIRVYVPRGQVTAVGDVTFVPGSGNVWPATISTYDDGTGHSIYVFFDDGTKASA